MITIVGLQVSCQSQSGVTCKDKFVIEGDQSIDFSVNERQLLCGDQNVVGWKNVPLSQTQWTLKKLLHGRGYFDSEFTVTDEHKLHVKTGELYKITDLVFVGAPKEFFKLKFVDWKDKPLTSDTLDFIENFTIHRLKSIGYGCATIQMQAIVETGVVRVEIHSGNSQFFPNVSYPEDTQSSINSDVLQRYYAFGPGDPYNIDLLTLTSRRIEGDGVVAHSNFSTTCEQGSVKVKQSVTLGASRLLKLGAGISTEEFPIFKASWKNSRIGDNASILFADLYASHRRQSLKLGYEWHVFPANRWFIEPSFEGRRVREKDQKYQELISYLPIGARLDNASMRIEFQTGPSGTLEDTRQGPTTGQKQFGLWRSSLQLTSHDYEIFVNDPRSGFRLGLDTSSVLLTSVDQVWASKITMHGIKLWNMKNYGPPKVVLGIRFRLDSVLAKNKEVRENIPQSYFTWLGGDGSVRGFSRRQLPDAETEIGTLSSFYVGTELRFVSKIAKGLDPFVFIDAGFLGKENLAFDKTMYWSPGLGLRYDSFIGVIRATMARGFVTDADQSHLEHFQYFLSLGREF